MSEPPSNRPNGAHMPPKPKPNPLRPMRKKPINPLVAKSRKPAPKPAATAKPNVNGTQLSLEEARRKYGGWSKPPPDQYQDIPIVTTKKALMDGLRYHLMKFTQSKPDDPPVDPTDKDEFARPVLLHRRDARAPPPNRMAKEETPEPRAAPDDIELERQARLKAEKETQRAVDQAKMAPVAKEAVAPKKPQKKQKEEKTQFSRYPKTQEAKKELDLKYEEALPWHLEDDDGKNVWVGSYVSALSETNVILMIDGDKFRMVPLEKWYRFTSKPPFRALDIEQAEAFLNKKMDSGIWAKRNEEKKATDRDLNETRKMLYGKGRMVKTESSTFKAASRSEKLDHDEIDMEDDEFQDDDDNTNFDRHNEDEEEREAKDRIKREQLGANLFGDADEQEIDKDLEALLKEEMERKELGKRTKKALIKRDQEAIYESDNSEENPWSSSSESSDDDEEEEGEEGDENAEKKKDGEDGDDKKDVGVKDGGASDKPSAGSSTPQGKHKHEDLVKRNKNLKRAGSPALSESSGNESTRKKLKKTSTTTAPGSRSGTPVPTAKSSALKKSAASRGAAAGFASDGEMTAGEMSDGAVAKRKIKLLASGRGSPAGSRAGSPNPIPSRAASPPAARAGSPGPIEPHEILEKIPVDGITIQELIKHFSGRLGDGPGQMNKSAWIGMVKKLCDYGPDKRLKRK